MKKLALFLGMAWLGLGVVKAEPQILADFGQVKVYVPLTSVETTYLWSLRTKQSLVGGETPLGSWKALEFTGGAVTSLDGQGSPFLGARLNLVSPAENWIPLAAVHPGLFAGYDFRANDWVYGLKGSISIF